MSGKVTVFCNWPECATEHLESMRKSPVPLCRSHLLELPADIRNAALNGQADFETMFDELMDARGFLCKHKQLNNCDFCKWDKAVKK